MFGALGNSQVAMESTGVYWIPVHPILEDEVFEVYLVNAQPVKHVPGRKTDVCDCQWICLLCVFHRGERESWDSWTRIDALPVTAYGNLTMLPTSESYRYFMTDEMCYVGMSVAVVG